MSKLISSIGILLGILSLSGCDSSSGRYTIDRHAACWQFDENADGTVEFDFVAMVYPDHGVIAFSPRCPELRLNLFFDQTSLPSKFDALDRAKKDPTKLIGVRGRAIGMPQHMDDATLLTVKVREVTQGRSLTDAETKGLR